MMNRMIAGSMMLLVFVVALSATAVSFAGPVDKAHDALARAEKFLDREADLAAKGYERFQAGDVKDAKALRTKAQHNLSLAEESLKTAHRWISEAKRAGQNVADLEHAFEKLARYAKEVAEKIKSF